jgi:hypothetical protein
MPANHVSRPMIRARVTETSRNVCLRCKTAERVPADPPCGPLDPPMADQAVAHSEESLSRGSQMVLGPYAVRGVIEQQQPGLR